MSTSAPPRGEGGIRGWGGGSRGGRGWRRSSDPIGLHTAVAAVLGVVIAALIGATLDPFNMQTSDDQRRAEQAAYDEAFAEARPAGEAAGVPHGRTEWIGNRIDADAALTGEWADAFRQGWNEGWNDALAALRSAAEQAGLPPDYTEFDVLAEFSRR